MRAAWVCTGGERVKITHRLLESSLDVLVFTHASWYTFHCGELIAWCGAVPLDAIDCGDKGEKSMSDCCAIAIYRVVCLAAETAVDKSLCVSFARQSETHPIRRDRAD
ncbi:hypothetical protein TNCV_3580121 [Trichonephila clavipes]|nr:hypothetical protein TNCV_3580121 [Trichonephila clavipes]